MARADMLCALQALLYHLSKFEEGGAATAHAQWEARQPRDGCCPTSPAVLLRLVGLSPWCIGELEEVLPGMETINVQVDAWDRAGFGFNPEQVKQ